MTDFSACSPHFVDGIFHDDTDGPIDVLNPATEERIGAVGEASANLTDEAVASAKRAQVEWARQPGAARAAPLKAMAQLVRQKVPQIADIIVREQGKLKALAEMEVAITAEYLDYMAEWGRRIEGEIIESDRPGEQMLLYRRPMGVVAGILPWNFPFFMVARKVAPALITGNAIVVKPSEETPYSAHAFAEIAAEANLPPGLFNLVNGRGRNTGEALVRHRDVAMISFTGSSAAGSNIMAQAAQNLTKVNLELGGKAPAIVMDDANVDLAVGILKASKSLNSGQACNCAERLLVHSAVADEFRDKLVEAMNSIRYGDPSGVEELDMGPLINRAAVERIDGLVSDARSRGAEILVGGTAGEHGAGFHYQPTVLAGVTQDMEAATVEMFGPIVLMEEVADLDEAIAKANDSEYGLTSSIFTAGLNNAMKAISELKFGETYVNRENFEAIQGFHAGVRKSGIGGADGKHGLYEYTHTQLAYIQT